MIVKITLLFVTIKFAVDIPWDMSKLVGGDLTKPAELFKKSIFFIWC